MYAQTNARANESRRYVMVNKNSKTNARANECARERIHARVVRLRYLAFVGGRGDRTWCVCLISRFPLTLISTSLLTRILNRMYAQTNARANESRRYINYR